MNGWVTFFQFLIGFLLVPLRMIPGFGHNSGHDLWHFFLDGAMCLIGQNTREHDRCGDAWEYFVILVAVMFLHNVLMPLTVNYVAASALYVCMAVVAVLTNVASTQEWIMGTKDVQPFRNYDIYALIIVVVGLLVFSVTSMSCFHRHLVRVPGFRRLCCVSYSPKEHEVGGSSAEDKSAQASSSPVPEEEEMFMDCMSGMASQLSLAPHHRLRCEGMQPSTSSPDQPDLSKADAFFWKNFVYSTDAPMERIGVGGLSLPDVEIASPSSKSKGDARNEKKRSGRINP